MNHVTTYIRQALHDIYPPGELRSLTKIICCDLLGQDAIDYYLGKDITRAVCFKKHCRTIKEKRADPIYSGRNLFLWVYVSGSSGCVDSSS